MSIHDFFAGDRVDLPALASWLDGLSNTARVQSARELSAKEQAQLYEAAKGFRPLTIADFVPPGTSPLAQVIHFGRNSLPMFKIFEKRFCRPPNGNKTELWGYNEQSMSWATGPGYFVCYDIDDGQVLIDYLKTPPGKPDTWPAIKPNSAGLSRFVYYRTQDTMRGVSNHVSIGRASRDGKPMDNWFVLCRDAAS